MGHVCRDCCGDLARVTHISGDSKARCATAGLPTTVFRTSQLAVLHRDVILKSIGLVAGPDCLADMSPTQPPTDPPSIALSSNWDAVLESIGLPYAPDCPADMSSIPPPTNHPSLYLAHRYNPEEHRIPSGARLPGRHVTNPASHPPSMTPPTLPPSILHRDAILKSIGFLEGPDCPADATNVFASGASVFAEGHNGPLPSGPSGTLRRGLCYQHCLGGLSQALLTGGA